MKRKRGTRTRGRNPEQSVVVDFNRNLAIVTLPEFQAATPDVQAALLVDAQKNPAKYDRCVRDVEARGSAANAYAVCTAAGLRGKRRKGNPESTAAALSAAFHGRPAQRVDEYVDDVHVHSYLTELGTLVEITVDTPSGIRAELDFSGEQLKLASNEAGTQLYIQGRTKLDLDTLKLSGKQWRKDLMVIGEMQSIVYRTAKADDGGEMVDYIHASGEDLVDNKHRKVTDVFPTLLYDVLNSELLIAGGQQEVRDVGIVR
jgi:hypothetical protein